MSSNPRATSDRYSPIMGDGRQIRVSVDRSNSSQLRQSMSDENRSNKEALTKGWNEHRKGNRSAAVHLWEGVYQKNPNNGFGARAKAYIAEAIEKDYDAAAGWYEKALSYDPKDKMSLYNYGVLLETAMNRKREAFDLYEAGAKLGDKAAARKAADLKKKMGY